MVSVLVPVASLTAASSVAAMRLPSPMTGTSTHFEIRDLAILAPPGARRKGVGAARTSFAPARAPQFSEEDQIQIGVVGHAPHHIAENRDAAMR